jgi:hypothetical protein
VDKVDLTTLIVAEIISKMGWEVTLHWGYATIAQKRAKGWVIYGAWIQDDWVQVDTMADFGAFRIHLADPDCFEKLEEYLSG